MDSKYAMTCFEKNLTHLDYVQYFLENQENSETSKEFRFAVAALLAMVDED